MYNTNKVEKQCTCLNDAKKLFGGNVSLAVSLMSRINALKKAETIKDIIVQPQFYFHNLDNKKRRNLDGFFAIDVKTRRDSWRIIIQPLDENENTFSPCNIDQIANIVRTVEVIEVSNHYE